MLYQMHDFAQSGLRLYFNALASAYTTSALTMKALQNFSPLPEACNAIANEMAASAEFMERFTKDYPKPAFNLRETVIDGDKTAIREEAVSDKPYCTLRHFKRDTARSDPKVLLVAPMSGHYATLLRGTVEALLPHHEVYITDWKNARDVPLSEGSFSLEDYISYVQDFLHELGPETHVMAICQPTVPVLAAISDMAARNDADQPLSMTLMGGPLDTSAAPTEVTRFAKKYPIEWFRDNLIAEVPAWYKGAGQRVYPGFLQLTGFMAMNPERHFQSHIDLFNHLRHGDQESAAKIKDFYDEYLSVADLSADFYLDTVKLVFQDHALPRGLLSYKGQTVDPSRIGQTALFTVEGGLDDISAPGQTTAAHDMCAGLDERMKFHYLQKGAGHYGIFNGRRWRENIAPRVAAFIRDIGEKHGLDYTATSEKLITPALWKPESDQARPSNDNDRTKPDTGPSFSFG